MKPAKSFVVEIKRNGRRQVVRDQEPLWDPNQLKSAADAIGEAQKASEIDPQADQREIDRDIQSCSMVTWEKFGGAGFVAILRQDFAHQSTLN